MDNEPFPRSRGLIADAIATIERGMTPRERLASIELPMRMRSLRKDPRGFPIPFIVMIDKTGMPQFTISDQHKVHACITKRLCSICGRRLDKTGRNFDLWLIGGARCFLHEHGAFLDPPMHRECGEYSLRVCPFLAARSYSKRIDDAKLKPGALPDNMILAQADHMTPSQPERFGFGLTHELTVERSQGGHVFVPSSWQYVEWWRQGETINAPDTALPEVS